MDCSTPGFPVHHPLPELAQTHVHRVSDAIQPSHPLSPSPAFNLSQHQGLFQWVSSSHQVAKVLEFWDLWLNIFCIRLKIELYLPSFPPLCNWGVGKRMEEVGWNWEDKEYRKWHVIFWLSNNYWVATPRPCEEPKCQQRQAHFP